MKRETDLFKIEEADLGKEHLFTADIDGPYMDGDGKFYGFVRRFCTADEIELRRKEREAWKKAGLDD